MKNLIIISLTVFCFFRIPAQDISVRVAQVQSNTISQNGINLSDTYGENIVGEDAQDGIVIVHGYYSGIVPDSMTSVRKIEELNGLRAFPNPTRDGLILTTEDPRHPEYLIRVISETSVLIKEVPWPGEETRVAIPFSQIPAGIYFVNVKEEGSGRESTMKIVRN